MLTLDESGGPQSKDPPKEKVHKTFYQKGTIPGCYGLLDESEVNIT